MRERFVRLASLIVTLAAFVSLALAGGGGVRGL
jgi:hypothetical protein